MSAAFSFLKSLQPLTEVAIVDGLLSVANDDAAHASDHHRRRALEEQFQLAAGADCLYDRPGHGFAYASWYHPRRVNHLITQLLPLVPEMPDELTVLDLGAGTGATCWALVLARAAVAHTGERGPSRINVLELDSSPSMLRASDLMYESLQMKLPQATAGVRRLPVHRPWLNPPEEARGGWIIAGHLFDATDEPSEVAMQIKRLLQVCRPRLVLLDSPGFKEEQFGAAVTGAENAGYSGTAAIASAACPFVGELPRVGQLRRLVLSPLGVPPKMVARDPKWRPHRGVRNCVLRPGAPAGDALFSIGPADVTLDEEQDRLAQPRDRFDVIVGAAGSGKTIVLVEAMSRRIVESLRSGSSSRVLFTTRNVAMIEHVVSMLTASLMSKGVDVTTKGKTEGDRGLTANASSPSDVRVEVRLINWDKVPTRLLGLPSSDGPDSGAIHTRIRQREKEAWPALDQYPQLRNVQWLCEELRRVIHGRNLRSKAEYLVEPRVGRVKPLLQTLRDSVWALLMDQPGQRGFTHLWIDAVDKLGVVDEDSRADHVQFDFAFVDEVQDFTATDLETVARFVPDANRVLVVGDSGQAMLLGTTFDIPGILLGRRRNVLRLENSYRLSRRLAEAVLPLAVSVVDATPASQRDWVGLPTGTRSGVLGYRVVVLRRETAATQLPEVLAHFAPVFTAVPNPTITIAEGRGRDGDLLKVANAAVPDAVCRCETMAAIKGLERTCVIWTTSSRWELDEGSFEFVHTVLTRAMSLAIVVLDERPNATHPDVRRAVSTLRTDRLLFWDENMEHAWDRFRHSADNKPVSAETVAPDVTTPAAPGFEPRGESAEGRPDGEESACELDLGRIIAKVYDGLSATWTEPRFNRDGWFHVGLTAACCPVCATSLEGFRSPYDSGGARYLYWALLCVTCQFVYPPASLDQSTRRDLYKSSEHRPASHPLTLELPWSRRVLALVPTRPRLGPDGTVDRSATQPVEVLIELTLEPRPKWYVLRVARYKMRVSCKAFDAMDPYAARQRVKRYIPVLARVFADVPDDVWRAAAAWVEADTDDGPLTQGMIAPPWVSGDWS